MSNQYKNPNPDWGIEETDWDNPQLSDYDNYSGNNYCTEYLDFSYAEEGNYIVKVFYFSNSSSDTKRIRPEVQINYNEEYLYFTSPTEMGVGR